MFFFQDRILPRSISIADLLFTSATLACAMRIMHIYRIYHPPAHLALPDASFELAWLGLWSWAELALGIIVTCSLSLPKIYRAKRSQPRSIVSSTSRPISPPFTFSWSFPSFKNFRSSQTSGGDNDKGNGNGGDGNGDRLYGDGDVDIEMLVPKGVEPGPS